MKKTVNYQLNKPEAGDPLRLADFNQNSDILDAALNNLNAALGGKAEQSALAAVTAAAPKIAIGSYVGTDASGSGAPNSLTFDFAPKALFVWGNAYVAQAIRGQNMQAVSPDKDATCTTTWNGNTVQWYAGYPAWQMNYNGKTYCYLAIG